MTLVKLFWQLLPELCISDLLFIETGDGNEIIGEPATTELRTGTCWYLAFL